MDEPFYLDKGYLKFRYHDGQKKIMDSKARHILALAGTQSGKTIIGSWWINREIILRGDGDYIIVAPNYPLMQKKVLPEFLKLFKDKLQLGEYRSADRIFEMKGSKIFFGHAQDPDSLESATAKAAWLDEAGQKKFKFASWEAILRRLSIHRGRTLITTTPYTLGWLKNELHDKADGKNIDLIRFDSIQNPAFPKAEYDERRESMPLWKFNMMYRGIFERPAGMIYDCFTANHKIPRFTIPDEWKRYAGIDFGGVNTCALLVAQNPTTKEYYVYRQYKAGSRTAKRHADEITKGEPHITAYGGSWGEDQWRDEFEAGGLYINKPRIKDVEVGIDRVYSLFKENKLFVFDDLAETINDLESYSRELDESGEPTETIEDKETYHYCDALRYIASYLVAPRKPMKVSVFV